MSKVNFKKIIDILFGVLSTTLEYLSSLGAHEDTQFKTMAENKIRTEKQHERYTLREKLDAKITNILPAVQEIKLWY